MTVLRTLRRLIKNRSGVAMTEFALGMPFLLTAGLWGLETANYAIVNMKIGQLTVHVADNASRIGDTSMLDSRRIFEEDMNDLLLGANIQGGPQLDLYQHGRVIVSSLEIFDSGKHKSNAKADGTQFVHWQRCKGEKVKVSEYASVNQDLPNGIGEPDNEVDAEEDSPVMFVEIYYDYQPLVSSRFIPSNTIKSTAAFLVRDNRDLEAIFKRKSATVLADCNTYDAFPAT
jgi:hypothetical protein